MRKRDHSAQRHNDSSEHRAYQVRLVLLCIGSLCLLFLLSLGDWGWLQVRFDSWGWL